MKPGVVGQMSRRDLAFVVARGMAVLFGAQAIQAFLVIALSVIDGAILGSRNWAGYLTIGSMIVGLGIAALWAWFNADRFGATDAPSTSPTQADDTVIFTRETLLHGVAMGVGIIWLVEGAIELAPVIGAMLGLKLMDYGLNEVSPLDLVRASIPFLVGAVVLIWANQAAKKLNDDFIIDEAP